jgi:hypothetical protein
MLNLKAAYGAEYRIVDEPGWGSAKGAPAVIPCRHGHIYQHSATMLGASTDRRGPTAKRLAKLGQVWQDGSDGLTIIFPPADFAAVAQLLGAKRRKRLSPEHRAKLVAAGKRFQIKAAQ